MAFCKILFEKTPNNLACALQCFLRLFCARFALLKTGHSNRNLNKKGLRIDLFLQFFLRPPSIVSNFNTSPMPPPFWKFFIRYIEQWTKTFCKKPVDRAGQKPVDRPVNRRWFWNLPVGSRKSWPVPSQVAILLANTKKSLKFYRFELARILVSLIGLNFFFWFVLLPRLALFLICS